MHSSMRVGRLTCAPGSRFATAAMTALTASGEPMLRGLWPAKGTTTMWLCKRRLWSMTAVCLMPGWPHTCEQQDSCSHRQPAWSGPALALLQ